jgi:hypothetical protein
MLSVIAEEVAVISLLQARRVSISERCKDSQKSFRIEHRLTRLLTHVMVRIANVLIFDKSAAS